METYTIFNGLKIEEEINCFKTLKASGTRFADVSAESSENPFDGSDFIKKRVPSRSIEVGFALETSGENAVAAQNRLQSILCTSEPKKLILFDDPDGYFNALCVGFELEEDVREGRYGTIKFECYDPFKHSLTEKEYTATKNSDGILSAEVVNNGNVAVPIDYEITMNSDNGYIGIASDQGAMQYGSIEETDGEEVQKSEILVALTDFLNAADDTSGTDGVHKDNYSHTGALGTNATWISGKKFLCLSSDTGTANNNGGMRTVTIPADSKGNKGATNFYCYLHAFLWTSAFGQTGNMMVSFLTDDNKPICALNWYKNDKTGNTAGFELLGYDSTSTGTASYKAGVKILKSFSYTASGKQSENPYYWNWGHQDIKKSGSKITYYYWGKYYTFDLPDTKDMVCTKIQITMHNVKDRSGSKAWARRGLDILKFTKTNIADWKDNPNRYSKGDVLKISGDEGKVYVNDMVKMGDEVTGTTYFKAQPGTNTIEIHNSEWASDVTAKIKIREAWL